MSLELVSMANNIRKCISFFIIRFSPVGRLQGKLVRLSGGDSILVNRRDFIGEQSCSFVLAFIVYAYGIGMQSLEIPYLTTLAMIWLMLTAALQSSRQIVQLSSVYFNNDVRVVCSRQDARETFRECFNPDAARQGADHLPGRNKKWPLSTDTQVDFTTPSCFHDPISRFRTTGTRIYTRGPPD